MCFFSLYFAQGREAEGARARVYACIKKSRRRSLALKSDISLREVHYYKNKWAQSFDAADAIMIDVWRGFLIYFCRCDEVFMAGEKKDPTPWQCSRMRYFSRIQNSFGQACSPQFELYGYLASEDRWGMDTFLFSLSQSAPKSPCWWACCLDRS